MLVANEYVKGVACYRNNIKVFFDHGIWQQLSNVCHSSAIGPEIVPYLYTDAWTPVADKGRPDDVLLM